MGEAKKRQYSREQLLREHPWCCYCGAPATTTDHCPPRALFYGREWPEGYEFPACDSCNREARRDEQIVSIIAKLWTTKDMTEDQAAYWQRMLNGLRTNQPDIFAEWSRKVSRNEQRNGLRRIFGRERGDELRKLGYGVADLGDSTQDAITRFGIKLCKALFYKHTGQILDGQIWLMNTSVTTGFLNQATLDSMLSITGFTSETRRGNINLEDQFIYWYNYKDDDTASLYAVVQFSDQLLYSMFAFTRSFLEDVKEQMSKAPLDPSPFLKVDATRRFWP